MKIRLCFKIAAEAGFAEDENGEPGEAFVCAALKDVKSYTMVSEYYEKAVESMRKIVAEQIQCDIELITPITLNEYLDNTEEEE